MCINCMYNVIRCFPTLFGIMIVEDMHISWSNMVEMCLPIESSAALKFNRGKFNQNLM